MNGNTNQTAHVFTAVVAAQDTSNNWAILAATGLTTLPVASGPAISNATLTPAILSADGGALAISATVSDADGGLNYWGTVCQIYADGNYIGDTYWSYWDGTNLSFSYSIGANTGTTGHVYTATIIAQDTLGLSATLPATGSTAQPAETGPVVSDATLTPPSLPASGGTLTISATLTDAESGFNWYNVYCEIYEDGNYIGYNYWSSWDGTNAIFSYNIGANPGTTNHVFTAVVVAVDTGGVQAAQAAAGSCTQCFATGGPVISAASASPSSLPATGGTVTVSANVTESDSDGNNLISNVFARYFIDGIDQGYAPLNSNGGGSTYTVDFGFGNNTTQAHTLTIEVTAQDTLGNSASCMATPAVSYAADTTPPVISTIVLTPTPLPVAGGTLSISATVTDNGANDTGVASVQALILCNNVEVTSIALNNGGSGNTYLGAYNVPLNRSTGALTYTVIIVATDNAGNTAALASPGSATQPTDKTGPSVSSVSLSPNSRPVSGGTITVNAVVTDSGSGLASVTAQILANGVYITPIPLSNGGSGSSYTGSYTFGANSSNVAITWSAVVVASDACNNTTAVTATGTCNQPTTSPATGPTISNATVQPATISAAGGNSFTVSASVTAASGVQSVSADIYCNKSYYTNLTLTAGTGNSYVGVVTPAANSDNVAYAFTAVVSATDNNNHVAYAAATGSCTQANDNVPPVITSATLTPATRPSSGGLIAITANVQDSGGNNVGVGNVSVVIYRDGNPVTTTSLTNGGSGASYGTIYAFPVNAGPGSHTYTAMVYAQDLNGNQSSAAASGSCVQPADTTGPVIANPSLTPATISAAAAHWCFPPA